MGNEHKPSHWADYCLVAWLGVVPVNSYAGKPLNSVRDTIRRVGKWSWLPKKITIFQKSVCIPRYIGYNSLGGINVDLLVVPLVAFVVFSSSSSSYHESSSGLFFLSKDRLPNNYAHLPQNRYSLLGPFSRV